VVDWLVFTDSKDIDCIPDGRDTMIQLLYGMFDHSTQSSFYYAE
jgi:hypothetical protein